LAPFVAELLDYNGAVGWSYVEPYAGGAGVAMELLLDKKVAHVYLNDSSIHIYAMWKAMVSDPDGFCHRISRASLSIDEWKMHREVVRRPGDYELADLGFSTFYLNRCNRSGILTAGVIGGFAQDGRWRIDARFSRNELISRIESIACRNSQITVTNLDAERFMLDQVNALPPETLVYCDPPYYERAERLYLNTYNHDDHLRLAQVVQAQLRRPWLVSYDGHPSIISMYRGRQKFEYSLHYSATRSYSGREVFIFSDRLKIPPTSCLPYVKQGIDSIERSARLVAE
jgi:DNA adenine methylase